VRGLGTTPAEMAARVPALQAAVAQGLGRLQSLAEANKQPSNLALPHPVL
jgi:hypothetical protein